MSGYVRSIKTEADFDGMKVVAHLRPMELEDTLKLRGKDEDVAVAYCHLFPKYVISISGVVDTDGVPVPVDEIARVTYFIPLVTELMEQHLAAAKPKDPTPPAVALAAS